MLISVEARKKKIRVILYIPLKPMAINYLINISARMGFFCRVKIFHRSSQIVQFPTMKHPKVTVDRASSVRIGFTQQFKLLFGFLSSFLDIDNFDYTLLLNKNNEAQICPKQLRLGFRCKFSRFNCKFLLKNTTHHVIICGVSLQIFLQL